jgi:NAD(P)-dependent dehydrogenase (short-subunit alcohol dehydrogenase family)
MHIDLAERTAVVTGSTAGIGFAIARGLAESRAATPEEVAHMVVYACSPQASATTGAALRVDGGVVETIA